MVVRPDPGHRRVRRRHAGSATRPRVYGPQKGATHAQVALLTRRLDRLADQYQARTGVDVRELPGAGAAGGLAGGLAAIGAVLEPGFDVVATAAGFEDAIDGVDLVITGEGKLDATSFAGKTVGGVLEWASDAGVPHLAVIAGQVTARRATRRPSIRTCRSSRSPIACGRAARRSPAPRPSSRRRPTRRRAPRS